MGVWVAVIIGLFVLGSMMALKPNGIDQRIDKLRMSARRLGLNPKLVACPEWVRGKDDEFGQGMIGQYGLVIDDIKMPHVKYQAMSGKWRLTENSKAGELTSCAHNLNHTALSLPSTIEPFVKALHIKANSIAIYWQDINYVRPTTNPKYSPAAIEPDLMALKDHLEAWARHVQMTPSTSQSG